MATVRIAPDFFKKERNQAYADWRLSFWRELFQNSIDQNASKINITIVQGAGDDVIVAFNDNGPGMTREVLENVYFAIGATTKSGPDQIGGMGRARILTCFAMKNYTIRSHNYVVCGQNGDYEISNVSDVFLRGCNLTIVIDDATVSNMTLKLYEFLEQSRLSASVFLNGSLLNVRAPLAGRHVRDLIVKDQAFAKVFVNKSADKRQVLVRVNGVAMFSEYIDAKAQVTIELDPGMSRSVLTSNRDGLRGDYHYALSRFLRQLAADTQSAIKDRFKRNTKVVNGGGMRRLRKPVAPKTPKTPAWSPAEATAIQRGIANQTSNQTSNEEYGIAEAVAFKRNMERVETNESGPEDITNTENERSSFGSWLSATFGDIYIYDETQTTAVHNVVHNYMPENWVSMTVQGKTFRKGGNILKVLLMWKVAVEYALEVSLEPLGKDELTYSVGFLFKDSAAAEHREQNGGHVFSLRPVNMDGKLDYAVRDRKSLKRLMTSAKHEAAHVEHSWHNEDFSGLREAIDERFDEAECFRRMKTALDMIPDFDRREARWAA